MNAIAIIPARGGSKGVPRKNVLPLAGRPLLGWTIEAAKNAELVDRVVVSTDNPEIADVATKFGAEVVWRPAELSGDLVSSEQAILHALNELEASGLPPITAFLQCTAPLMTSDDIDGTIAAIERLGADTSVAVADFHYFVWKTDDRGDFVGVNHDKMIRKMRQERTPQYIETGSVYAMKTEGFLKHRHRFFGKTAHYVMPPDRVLEIDDPVDFKIAQMLLEEKLKRVRADLLPKKIELIVFDFDGVFTDDRVLLSEDGVESVACSRSDGMGIKLAREAGIPMLILSTEQNEVVMRRAEKLKLEAIHGVNDKRTTLQNLLDQRNIAWDNVVYVGNDVNDVDCLLHAGCGVAVANANQAASAAANMILGRNGGDNAVRELIDLILSRSE
ncbi:N-acylneuraminate cytidylyltransferase [Novipirellula galeiformis]|uniref:N-acylneuraminate cytidylyltransferase n=1 Tax=Novipirellula galeiformis TaxID=2528004 RepID=A0A5C6C9F2_9BACT|nr:acylneuraminate cytidylyltransferase [Novipirellula galeiformis]TWU21220.1 N-acylneuraminate cytidylyltransferase [Novipirellula galeiformis]